MEKGLKTLSGRTHAVKVSNFPFFFFFKVEIRIMILIRLCVCIVTDNLSLVPLFNASCTAMFKEFNHTDVFMWISA